LAEGKTNMTVSTKRKDAQDTGQQPKKPASVKSPRMLERFLFF